MDNSTYIYLLWLYETFSGGLKDSPETVIERLEIYQSLIKNWTYRLNLVSQRDVENLWKKHIVPSLKPLEFGLLPENSEVLDAGSGAGFPGIPLKIMRPDIKITLCESQRKRALFLTEVVEKLELKKVDVFRGRVEDVDHHYDVIVSRAMGKPNNILKVLLNAARAGGKVIIWTAKTETLDSTGIPCQIIDLEDAGKLLVIDNP